MGELFWRLRYAFIIRRRAALPLRFVWQCSGAGWEANVDMPLSPDEAVTEKLSCWGE